MTFIVLLLALLAERFLIDQREWRKADWFQRYHSTLAHHPQGGWTTSRFWGSLAILAPVLVAIALAQWVLAGLLGGLLSFLFAFAVLLYCLGPEDLDNEAADFLYALGRGEEEKARLAAARICDGEPAGTAVGLVRQVREAILHQSNRRIFGVIFWFLVLGPLGAALYRMARCLPQGLAGSPSEEYAQGRRRLIHILDWLPSRALVLAFALAGNFENTLDAWRGWEKQPMEVHGEAAQGLLIQAGNGALMIQDEDNEEENPAQIEAALSLVWRSLAVWLVILGLLALIF
ncbi:MAG: regulatory signaling modulator protein AmpE [Gammaproteobacteria bacterium]|nr:regulatory signaling modulator protein AmpE [Gammaproteobacteria bacterium]MBU1656358.1 regulatory signaling modulator protein AmpE [Gammaproteobacteria bacterium]MBU1959922.1 regulatory signaling modulator protein AmpE [Gammaproteobacteria bacterium]